MFLINVQHTYLFWKKFSFQHGLIRSNTFIRFQDIFVPTLLLGTKRFLNFNIWHQIFSVSRYSIAYYIEAKLLNSSEIVISQPLIPTFYFYFDGFSWVVLTAMFIRVFEKFHPTCLLGPTRLLNIQSLSIQHVYLDHTFIRNIRVVS